MCSLPYSWHTLPAEGGWTEQVHAESEEEQREPVEFMQVEPVPQNTAELPAVQDNLFASFSSSSLVIERKL